jgi:predicted homoserine dehydrogenase-like protein
MAIAANGTGLLPDIPTGHRPVVRYTELAEVMCPMAEGGILDREGVIDIPTILHKADEPNAGGGIFVVVRNADEVSRAMMIRKELLANSQGTALMFYRPYHLVGGETAMSILCAGLLGVPTGSNTIQPHVDITMTTTRDFAAGETLGQEGELGWNRDLHAALVPGYALSDDGPAPFFMAQGARLLEDAPAGTLITLDMIERPEDAMLWSLRQEQDARFFGTRNH